MSDREKAMYLRGWAGGRFGVDDERRVYRVVSPGGLQPGAEVAKVPPGPQGDYWGTCIGCLQPTDTVLAIRGTAKVHIGFLMWLGMGFEEAVATAQKGWADLDPGLWDGDPEHVPGGEWSDGYQVCARCAPEQMKPGLPPDIPCYVLSDHGEKA